MREKLKGALQDWLISLFFTFALLSLVSQLAAIPVHAVPVFLILALFTGAFSAIRRLWGSPAALAFFAAAALLTVFFSDTDAAAEFVRAVAAGEFTEASFIGDTAALLLAGAVSVIAAYVLRGFVPRAVLSVGWVIFWIIAAFRELQLPKSVFCAMLPILLFTLSEALHRFGTANGKAQTFQSISSGLMVLFAISAFIIVMPAPATPYGWPLVKSLWGQVEKLCYNIETGLFYRHKGGEEFGLSFNGFSDTAGTGSGFDADLPQVIHATPKDATNGNLYLAGNSWDTFNGNSWSSTIDEEAAKDLLDWNLDTAEHIYALWRYKKADLADARNTGAFFRENNVFLNYENMNTRTLFTTRNLLLIRTKEDRYPFQAKPGAVVFDFLQKSGTYYRLYWLEQNARVIGELISFAEGYEYGSPATELWINVQQEFRKDFVLSVSSSMNTEAVFRDRAALIGEVYLTVPDDTTDRVRQLARDITEGCDSDYEKLMAIGRYLRENYAYTTAPSPVPRAASFTDYVLFEAKEGYCTWYATAAAILARCVDIPARYVQGYSVKLPQDKTVDIVGTDSHAWCEGYVAGYGWVTVEATPGFSSSGTGWSIGDETGFADSSDSYEDEEYYDEGYNHELPPPPPAEIEEEEPIPEPRRFPVQLAIMAVFLLALAGVILADRRWGRARRRYEAASFSEKAVLDLEGLLKGLARHGYARRDDESIRKYFTRIGWSSIAVEAYKVREMALLYEEVLFAGRQLTEEEWRNEKAFADELRKRRR